MITITKQALIFTSTPYFLQGLTLFYLVLVPQFSCAGFFFFFRVGQEGVYERLTGRWVEVLHHTLCPAQSLSTPPALPSVAFSVRGCVDSVAKEEEDRGRH